MIIVLIALFTLLSAVGLIGNPIVAVGAVLGLLFFGWAFDLYQPDEIEERGKRKQFMSTKEGCGCLIWLLALVLLVLMNSGCAARGEGITVGNGLINTGASQVERDRIARERTQAEIAKVEAETVMKQAQTQAAIEQGERTGAVWRAVLLSGGIAAAIACLWISGGYALQRATPMAQQGVRALETALELRKAKSIEITMQIGPNGYVGHLLAQGYTQAELADLIRQNPALDAPRLQQLQARVGPHGMKALSEAGELETTLALLPDPELTEEVEHD